LTLTPGRGSKTPRPISDSTGAFQLSGTQRRFQSGSCSWKVAKSPIEVSRERSSSFVQSVDFAAIKAKINRKLGKAMLFKKVKVR
jgi:hypothetical protein